MYKPRPLNVSNMHFSEPPMVRKRSVWICMWTGLRFPTSYDRQPVRRCDPFRLSVGQDCRRVDVCSQISAHIRHGLQRSRR